MEPIGTDVTMLKLLGRSLECAICLDRLRVNDNRVLPCQHTYHLDCLKLIFSRDKLLTCPECRRVSLVPIEKLLPNYSLNKVLDSLPPPATTTVKYGDNKFGQLELGLEESDTISQSKRVMSPVAGCFCKVLYNYSAQHPSCLSLKEGQMIRVLDKVDSNWLRGEIEDSSSEGAKRTGLFPTNHVEVVDQSDYWPLCTALFDFQPGAGRSTNTSVPVLPMKKGTVIELLDRVDQNWAKGRLSNTANIGIFPLNYVAVNTAARKLLQSKGAAYQTTKSSTLPCSSLSSPANPTAETASMNQQPDLIRSLTPVDHPKHRKFGASFPSSSMTLELSRLSVGPQNPISSPSPSLSEDYSDSARTHSMVSGYAKSNFKEHPRRHSVNPEINSSQVEYSRMQSTSMTRFEHPRKVSASATLTARRSLNMAESATTNYESDFYYAARSSANIETRNCDYQSRDLSRDNNSSLPRLFVAIHDYRAAKKDEIDLKRGNTYIVDSICSDGWYQGVDASSFKSSDQFTIRGAFPGNYLVPADISDDGMLKSLGVLNPDGSENEGELSEIRKTPFGTTVQPPRRANYSKKMAARSHNRSNSCNKLAASENENNNNSISWPKKYSLGGLGSASMGFSGSRRDDYQRLVSPGITIGPDNSPNAQEEQSMHKSTFHEKYLYYLETNGLQDSAFDHQEKCVAIAAYPPQNETEVELNVGDIVAVDKRHEDGWITGLVFRTGKSGLLPSSFVVPFANKNASTSPRGTNVHQNEGHKQQKDNQAQKMPPKSSMWF